MILDIWQIYLYQPLVNLLIYLYNTVAAQNLGWAVVSLTVLLRIALLPLSIVSERNKLIYKKMEEHIAEAERVHRADPVYLKEQIRLLAKKFHLHPWAKTISLGIQLVVLVLLYQVFITGTQELQLSKILYPSVDYPGPINSVFMTIDYADSYSDRIIFDVGERSALWAGLVALVLFFDIFIPLKRSHRSATSADLAYTLLFPIASFLILWYLPMVKALFILTSILFSYVLSLMRIILWKEKA